MDWLNSLSGQLPMLLVLSPVIGFLSTLIAAKTERDLARPLAISNCLCTAMILSAVIVLFLSESISNTSAIQRATQESAQSEIATNALDVIHVQLQRQRVERIRHQFFAVDGLNLGPIVVLMVVTFSVVCRARTPDTVHSIFLPMVLLFQASSIAGLASCDVRAFLLSCGSGTFAMTVLLGRYAGHERRELATRFLLAQFCATSLIMLGFGMLVVGVPWMKIEDSPTLPTISYNVIVLIDEVQRWSHRNELAFHYVNDVFPLMLLVLSTGFAIQFGLFPFHAWQASVLKSSSADVCVLCVCGTIAMAAIGWLRIVMPLAPQLMAGFDRFILIQSIGGAIWGSLRAISANTIRERIAFLFISVSGLSLLGIFCFTTTGMTGAWLMMQQLILSFSTVTLALETPLESASRIVARDESHSTLTTRAVIGWLGLTAVGSHASGAMIFSELLRENLLVLASATIVVIVNAATVLVTLNRHFEHQTVATGDKGTKRSWNVPLILIVILVAIANLAPNWMLRQCEPEFDRVFRRYERAAVRV